MRYSNMLNIEICLYFVRMLVRVRGCVYVYAFYLSSALAGAKLSEQRKYRMCIVFEFFCILRTRIVDPIAV